MRNLLFIALIIALVVVVVLILKAQPIALVEETTSQSDLTAEGEGTTEPEAAESDETALLVVSSPGAGATVADPLVVSGQARGYWFFEATAPVVVTNWDGLIIGEGYITAADDWMTEDFVPFSGTIDYELPAETYSATGTIIFKRANPSDLPENDAAFEISVQLQST